jgi:hypothetical protein
MTPKWTIAELMEGVPASLPRGNNTLKPWKRHAVLQLLRRGKSVREITKVTEVSSNTITKIRREMTAEEGQVFCPCGKPARHGGWCRVRFEGSPRRQMVMARIHESRRATKFFKMLAAPSFI